MVFLASDEPVLEAVGRSAGRWRLPLHGANQIAVEGSALYVQYWESAEHLQAYARAEDGAHFPAWADFERRVERTNAVGGRHESTSRGAPPEQRAAPRA